MVWNFKKSPVIVLIELLLFFFHQWFECIFNGRIQNEYNRIENIMSTFRKVLHAPLRDVYTCIKSYLDSMVFPSRQPAKDNPDVVHH